MSSLTSSSQRLTFSSQPKSSLTFKHRSLSTSSSPQPYSFSFNTQRLSQRNTLESGIRFGATRSGAGGGGGSGTVSSSFSTNTLSTPPFSFPSTPDSSSYSQLSEQPSQDTNSPIPTADPRHAPLPAFLSSPSKGTTGLSSNNSTVPVTPTTTGSSTLRHFSSNPSSSSRHRSSYKIMASPITPLCLPTRIDGSGLPSPNGSSSAAAATEPGGAGPSLSSFLVMNSRVLHLILDKISSLETGVGRLEQSFYKHFSSPPCQGEGVETEPRRDSEDDDKAAWAESLRVQIQNAFDHFKDQVGQVLTDQTQLIEDLNTWTGAADARHAQDIKEISDAVDERVQMALDTFYEQAREDVSEQRRILQDLSAWTTAFDARHARQGDEIKDTVAKQIHASVHDIQEQVRQELSAWSSALDARHAQEIGETQTAFNATQAQNRQEMSAWTTAFDARHAQQTRTLNLIAQQNADILMEQNRVLKSSTLQRPGDGPSERHAFMDASPPVVVIRDVGYHSPSEGDQFGLYTDSEDELHRSTSSIPTAQRRDSPIAEQTTSPSEASKGKRVLRREHAPPAMTSSPGADYQIRLNFGTEGLVSMAADVLTTSSTPGSSNPKEPYVIIDDEDDAVVIIGGLHNLVTRETMRKRGAETSTTLATTSKRRLRLRNAGTVGSPSSPTLTTAVVNRPKVDLVSLQDKPMSVKMEGVMDYSQRLTRSVRKTAQPDVIHLDLDSVKERAREAGIPWWKRI